MFIRNPKSIKRPTVRVNKETKEILEDFGFSPISMENGEWIFLCTDDVKNLISDIDIKNTMGGVSHGQ